MRFFGDILPFGACALGIMAVFYAIYFGKKIAQGRRGIVTRQIGKRKEKGIHTVETVMSVATLLVVAGELFSVSSGWNYAPNVVRWIGLGAGATGDVVFLAAVLCMRDSWRAGIPEKDKTELVTRGIFKISRNPAFLGFDFVYIGVAALFFNPVNAVLSLFAIVSLHLQILQEEKFLATTFGVPYLIYKKSVCRYFGRKFCRNRSDSAEKTSAE